MKDFLLVFSIFIILSSLISSLTIKKDLNGYYYFAAVLMTISLFITKVPTLISDINTDTQTSVETENNYWDSIIEITKTNIETDICSLCDAKNVIVTLDSDTMMISSVSVYGASNISHAYEVLHEKYGIEREDVVFDR